MKRSSKINCIKFVKKCIKSLFLHVIKSFLNNKKKPEISIQLRIYVIFYFVFFFVVIPLIIMIEI